MTRKSKKPTTPICPDTSKLAVESETDSRRSSAESWKARYEEMLDIALLPTQEEKDAAMAKIEIGKNSYVDSIRKKGRGCGFGESPKESTTGTMESVTTGIRVIQEREPTRASEESPQPSERYGRKDHPSSATKDMYSARLVSNYFPRAEQAMDSVLTSLRDVAGQVVNLFRSLLFSPRFHLVLEIFTIIAVAVLVWVAGEELPFRLAVLGIMLVVHGVLSLP